MTHSQNPTIITLGNKLKSEGDTWIEDPQSKATYSPLANGHAYISRELIEGAGVAETICEGLADTLCEPAVTLQDRKLNATGSILRDFLTTTDYPHGEKVIVLNEPFHDGKTALFKGLLLSTDLNYIEYDAPPKTNGSVLEILRDKSQEYAAFKLKP